MDRRSYLKTTLALGGSVLAPAGVLALAGCSGTARTNELAGFNGNIMGTGYSVRLGPTDAGLVSTHSTDALATRIQAQLEAVDQHMSTWRQESELSRFNASGNSDWQPLSSATTQVIAHAMEASRLSDGAFDATVGPLVDLWGFGAGAVDASGSAVNRKPLRQAIHRNLSRVGYASIQVDTDTNAVRKLNPDAQLDLSGIAKGHGVDRMAQLLDEAGRRQYLVEIGGELRARGRKPDGTAWKVAIERPDAGRRDVFRVVNLVDAAIATSGDYRNFFADGGQRYSHSIDPRTGLPVDHELASVSVIADSTMAADALSTAFMIMGPDDAMAHAERHGIATQMILKSGKALKEVYSGAFEGLIA